VPHVLALHRRQIHVLTQVVLRRPYPERLHLLLSLKVVLGDFTFDDEGANFNFLLDLLPAFEFDLSDHSLGLQELSWLLLQVVLPLGHDLRLVSLIKCLQKLR
jgi:hypothetical protein